MILQIEEMKDEPISVKRFITRRASMYDVLDLQKGISDEHPLRRHSSFNPRNRQINRDDHTKIEDYLFQKINREISFRVNNLLNFHSSFEISLEALSWNDSFSALHFSCPVLSYMHDTDEDSIDIQIAKRPTLVSATNGSRNFENLNDNHVIALEFNDRIIEPTCQVQRLDKENYSTFQHGKRRNSHSCRRLERVSPGCC
jgi:hypothetical protein